MKHYQFVGDAHLYKCEKNFPVRMYFELDREPSKCYEYLYMLQSPQSYEIFQEGKRLFLKKWSTNKQVTNCLKSFFKVWGKPVLFKKNT